MTSDQPCEVVDGGTWCVTHQRGPDLTNWTPWTGGTCPDSQDASESEA